MTASAHRYTCDQLGACQARTTPCQACPSEGTASAQRIIRSTVGQPAGNCPPGVCMGLATCADTLCHGHPCNDVPDGERDPVATARFWRWYIGACCVLLLVGGIVASRW